MAAKTYPSRRCRSLVSDIQIGEDNSDDDRQEQAAEDPESLAQETIIENLSPKEAQRLSRVRNIGIAVRRPQV